jgi:hypothetical protein
MRLFLNGKTFWVLDEFAWFLICFTHFFNVAGNARTSRAAEDVIHILAWDGYT